MSYLIQFNFLFLSFTIRCENSIFKVGSIELGDSPETFLVNDFNNANPYMQRRVEIALKALIIIDALTP